LEKTAESHLGKAEAAFEKRDVAAGQMRQIEGQLEGLETRIRSAGLTGMVVKQRQLTAQYNALVAQHGTLRRQAVTQQMEGFERREKYETIVKTFPEIGRETVPVETVEFAEKEPLTPEKFAEEGRGYVTRRVVEATGVPRVRRELEVYRETRRPRELMKSLIWGQQAVQFGPAEAGFAAVTTPAAYTGMVGTRELIREAERIKGREFPFREQYIFAGEIAGQWAAISALMTAPEAIKRAPRVIAPKVEAIKMKWFKPKQVIYPEMVEPTFWKQRIELKKMGIELPAKLELEFARGVAAKPPKPAVKPTKFIKELKPTAPKPFRQFAPKELTPELRKALPELRGYVAPRGVKMLQIVRTKPKIVFEKEFPGFPGVLPGAPPKKVAFAPPESYAELAKRLPRRARELKIAVPIAAKAVTAAKVGIPEIDRFVEQQKKGLEFLFKPSPTVFKEFRAFARAPKPRSSMIPQRAGDLPCCRLPLGNKHARQPISIPQLVAPVYYTGCNKREHFIAGFYDIVTIGAPSRAGNSAEVPAAFSPRSLSILPACL